jgi:hypothetical protein
MKNANKSILTAEWLTIKTMYEANTNGSNKYGTNFPIDGELDQLTMNFIDKIGDLTNKMGFECVIDGVHMNLWKERIWSLVENAGLLPEIAWKDELAEEEAEIQDNWYSDNDDFDADLEAQSYEVFGLNKI